MSGVGIAASSGKAPYRPLASQALNSANAEKTNLAFTYVQTATRTIGSSRACLSHEITDVSNLTQYSDNRSNSRGLRVEHSGKPDLETIADFSSPIVYKTAPIEKQLSRSLVATRG